MKVNELVLAKIAVQMGVNPFVSEKKGDQVISVQDYLIDRTVLNKFISENKIFKDSQEGTFDLSHEFIEEQINYVTRARLYPTSVILSEQSCLGRGHLTEEIISRLDVLCNLIDKQDFPIFIEYLATGVPGNTNFEKAKAFIENWIKTDIPLDYIGLLECRLFDQNYEAFYADCIFADSILSYLLAKNDEELIYSESKYGGHGLRVLSQLQSNKPIKIKALLGCNEFERKVTEWQLSLAGFVQTAELAFEFSREEVLA